MESRIVMPHNHAIIFRLGTRKRMSEDKALRAITWQKAASCHFRTMSFIIIIIQL